MNAASDSVSVERFLLDGLVEREHNAAERWTGLMESITQFLTDAESEMAADDFAVFSGRFGELASGMPLPLDANASVEDIACRVEAVDALSNECARLLGIARSAVEDLKRQRAEFLHNAETVKQNRDQSLHKLVTKMEEWHNALNSLKGNSEKERSRLEKLIAEQQAKIVEKRATIERQEKVAQVPTVNRAVLNSALNSFRVEVEAPLGQQGRVIAELRQKFAILLQREAENWVSSWLARARESSDVKKLSKISLEASREIILARFQDCIDGTGEFVEHVPIVDGVITAENLRSDFVRMHSESIPSIVTLLEQRRQELAAPVEKTKRMKASPHEDIVRKCRHLQVVEQLEQFKAMLGEPSRMLWRLGSESVANLCAKDGIKYVRAEMSFDDKATKKSSMVRHQLILSSQDVEGTDDLLATTSRQLEPLMEAFDNVKDLYTAFDSARRNVVFVVEMIKGSEFPAELARRVFLNSARVYAQGSSGLSPLCSAQFLMMSALCSDIADRIQKFGTIEAATEHVQFPMVEELKADGLITLPDQPPSIMQLHTEALALQHVRALSAEAESAAMEQFALPWKLAGKSDEEASANALRDVQCYTGPSMLSDALRFPLGFHPQEDPVQRMCIMLATIRHMEVSFAKTPDPLRRAQLARIACIVLDHVPRQFERIAERHQA